VALQLAGLRKTFGTVQAVDGVDLAVEAGEFFALLGPSGCGKTTLLRLIAGIYPADAGRVVLKGRDITRVAMHRRNLAMVFQNYALFPHLTAFDNVAFGLRSRRIGAAEIRQRVDAALALVRLEGFAGRHPGQMSGGQQQRVALARALAVEPDLLLLDEPLSNLDARLRDEMRTELRDLQRRLGITTILVTHDIGEAFAMSGRAVDIYHRPANRFVANFVGPINEIALDVVVGDGSGKRGVTVDGLAIRLGADATAPHEGSLRLILRPESVRIGITEGTADNCFDATIDDVVFLGSGTECRLTIGALRLLAILPSMAAAGLRAGDRVRIGWNAADGVVTGGG
jgi:putative spermidine/putrescine transport system ATP-binding protein